MTSPLATGDPLRVLIRRHLAAFDRREAGADLRRADLLQPAFTRR